MSHEVNNYKGAENVSTREVEQSSPELEKGLKKLPKALLILR